MPACLLQTIHAWPLWGMHACLLQTHWLWHLWGRPACQLQTHHAWCLWGRLAYQLQTTRPGAFVGAGLLASHFPKDSFGGLGVVRKNTVIILLRHKESTSNDTFHTDNYCSNEGVSNVLLFT